MQTDEVRQVAILNRQVEKRNNRRLFITFRKTDWFYIIAIIFIVYSYRWPFQTSTMIRGVWVNTETAVSYEFGQRGILTKKDSTGKKLGNYEFVTSGVLRIHFKDTDPFFTAFVLEDNSNINSITFGHAKMEEGVYTKIKDDSFDDRMRSRINKQKEELDKLRFRISTGNF